MMPRSLPLPFTVSFSHPLPLPIRRSSRASRLGRALAPIVLLLVLSGGRAGAVTLGLDPGTAVVAPGDPLVLELVVGARGTDVVGDFDVDVEFDPAVLSLTGFVLADTLGDPSFGDALDFSLGELMPGLLNLAVVSTLASAVLDGIQGDPFGLATLEFDVLPGAAPGLSSVGLLLNALGDGDGLALVPTAVAGAELTVIPEPGVVLLLGLGLGLLAVRRA